MRTDTLTIITILLSSFLGSHAADLRLRSSVLNEDLTHKKRSLIADGVDPEVYAAAIVDFPDDEGMLALTEQQNLFLQQNAGILNEANLADGATQYFQSIGFPGIDRVKSENCAALDAYFSHDVGALGCWNLWCEAPVSIGLYALVNVGAAVTKLLIAAVAKLLLVPTGGSSVVIAVMLGVILSLGVTVGNELVPVIVHEACCNLHSLSLIHI